MADTNPASVVDKTVTKILINALQLSVQIDVYGTWPDEQIALRKLEIDGKPVELAVPIDEKDKVLVRLGVPNDNRFRLKLADGSYLQIGQQFGNKNTSTVHVEFNKDMWMPSRDDDKPHTIDYFLKKGIPVRRVESWAGNNDRFRANNDGVVTREVTGKGVARETILYGERGQFRVERSYGTAWGFKAASDVWTINNKVPDRDAIMPKWNTRRVYSITKYSVPRFIVNWTKLFFRSGRVNVPVINDNMELVTEAASVAGRSGRVEYEQRQWTKIEPVRFDAAARAKLAERKAAAATAAVTAG